MTQELIEDPEPGPPERPYVKTPALLDMTCDCGCGEKLVPIIDARGIGYYLHAAEVEG